MSKNLCATVEFLEQRLCFSGAADLTHDVSDPLSNPNVIPTAVSVGKNAVFTGGFVGAQAVADLFSSISGNWSTHALRGGAVLARAGDKVLFASSADRSRSVELYDAKTQTWQIEKQSKPYSWYLGVSADDKAFFVGATGSAYYDGKTGKWSRLKLPNAFTPSFGVSIAGNPYFAASNGDIRMYEAQTRRWKEVGTTNFRVTGLVAVGSHIIATGFTLDSSGNHTVASIFDSISDTTSVMSGLAQGADAIGTTVGNKAIFAGPDDNIVGVYDATTNTWSTTTLSQSRFNMAAATAGTHAIFAGGSVGHDTHLLKTVDMFTDTTPAAVLSGGLTGNIGHRDTVTVINTGDADLAGPYSINLYASTDRTLTGAILVGSRVLTSPLAAGASATFSVRTIQPKDLPAGTYHLLAAVADGSGHLTPIAAEDSTFRIGPAHTANPAIVQATKRFSGAFTRATHLPGQWM